MDELDLLKQHWKKDNNFQQIDKEEIQLMRHKSSSSIVKWIFIISVIELAIGFILGLVINTDDMGEYPFYAALNQVYGILFQGVIIYFIYRFFKSYANIRNSKNTNVLLKNILDTRKQVNNYIKFNIYSFAFMFLFISMEITVKKLPSKDIGEQILILMLTAIVTVIFGFILFKLIKAYYNLLYTRLLNKLDANYEELNRLESEEE